MQSQTAVTGYTIFYRLSSAFGFTSVSLGAGVVTYSIPNPTPFVTYEVKVTAANNGGNSAVSTTVSKGKCVTMYAKSTWVVY